MITRCQNCGNVLTNEEGERLRPANFDSSLPHRRADPNTTWSRCDPCYATARSQQEKELTRPENGLN